jgi:hypothetical protein
MMKLLLLSLTIALPCAKLDSLVTMLPEQSFQFIVRQPRHQVVMIGMGQKTRM